MRTHDDVFKYSDIEMRLDSDQTAVLLQALVDYRESCYRNSKFWESMGDESRSRYYTQLLSSARQVLNKTRICVEHD